MINRNKYIFIFQVFIYLVLTSISAQEVKFSRIDGRNGLSQSVVNAVVQDKKGFMWFGTDDGLNKYNGLEIKVFKRIIGDSSSLSHNGILSLFSDRAGDLWVGTNGGGLNKFISQKNEFVRFELDPNDRNSLSNNIVRVVFEDSKQNLWLGTDDGLNLFDEKSNSFRRFGVEEGLKNTKVWSVVEDKDGLIWIGTYGGGLFSLNTIDFKFEQIQDLTQSGELVKKHSEKIRCIYVEDTDNLILGTHGASIFLYNKKTKKFEYPELFPKDENVIVTSILKTSESNYWIGTKKSLIDYNKNTGLTSTFQTIENNPYSISANCINCIYQDKASSIWIGTNPGGLSVYHKSLNNFGHYKNLNDSQDGVNNIYGFAQEKNGTLWLATYGAGIDKYDVKLNTHTFFDKKANKCHENILSLYIDSDSLLWFGSHGSGANYYDIKNKVFGPNYEKNGVDSNTICNNNVMCITEDVEGNIWFGTFKGISIYNKKIKQFRRLSSENGLSGNLIYTIKRDNKNNMWIGTAGEGLNYYDISTGKITVFKENEKATGLSNNTVNCVYLDKKDNFWIGTAMGLNRYDFQNGKFTNYYEKNGLPNDYIYGILEDQSGNLWMSTNKGISRLKYDNGNAEFRNFSAEDGLQSMEFNQGAYFKSTDNQLLFGGINGYNSFYPEKIEDNHHIPEIYITSFKIFEKEVNLDSILIKNNVIELSYKDNFFSFEFVALDYVLSDKNNYSYKMDGVDKDWVNSSTRRFANYTDLAGGEYTFRVRGSNNDGVWSENEAVIQIKIIPPFWKTTWFIIFIVIAGISLLLIYIRLRTRKIEFENKLLEQKVSDRTKELAEKNKDITDSIQYAKRIQEAILPDKKAIYSAFKDSFILYKPKDIVSGDFYWFHKISKSLPSENVGKSVKSELMIIAVVDCTGHGVPGAFMSMIGHNLLNQIVVEQGVTNPSEILTLLNIGVQTALKQNRSDIENNDGMDVSLCTINVQTNNLVYAGAYRPLYIIRKGLLEKFEGNKFPIGGIQLAAKRKYISHEIQLEVGDSIYMFSDGYVDQFGGVSNKKYMTKRLQQVLQDIGNQQMSYQSEVLDKNIEVWKNGTEQIDDILVVGIRF